MPCLRVLVVGFLCSVYALWVGNNGSSNTNNGLFRFNSNNTPGSNNNASRLIQSEGGLKPSFAEKQIKATISIRYMPRHCIPHTA